MMKKYILSLAVGLTAFACADQDYDPAFQPYVGMNSAGLPSKFLEDDGSIKIPVIYGGDLANPSAFNVAYTITGGEYDVDYTVEGGSSASGVVSIPAGKIGSETTGFITIKSIPDFDTEADVPLTVTLTSVDNAGIRVGFPFKSEYKVTLANDDCDYVFEDLTGTATSTEVYAEGDPYGPYDTEFAVVGENRIKMDNFWDNGMEVELIYHPEDRTVEVVDREWDQFGFDWKISGTGKLNTCGNGVTITVHFVSVGFEYDETFDVEYVFEEEE